MTNLFYRYYDILYRDKDYKTETNLIFRLSAKFGISSPKRVLEIGCGTGNHTKELAKRKVSVVAIDIDENMVKLARQKIKEENVRIKYTSVEKLRDTNFDLVLAMFNVVTYIKDTAKLLSFMKAVSRRLRPGGIFVFDCWNGVAALRDPPKIKTASVKYNTKRVDYTLTPITDFFNQVSTITYEIVVTDGKRRQQDSYSFPQTLWTPMQIQSAIKKAGMETLFCSPLMKPGKPATYKDWKIMFCCRKPK